MAEETFGFVAFAAYQRTFYEPLSRVNDRWADMRGEDRARWESVARAVILSSAAEPSGDQPCDVAPIPIVPLHLDAMCTPISGATHG